MAPWRPNRWPRFKAWFRHNWWLVGFLCIVAAAGVGGYVNAHTTESTLRKQRNDIEFRRGQACKRAATLQKFLDSDTRARNKEAKLHKHKAVVITGILGVWARLPAAQRKQAQPFITYLQIERSLDDSERALDTQLVNLWASIKANAEAGCR